MVNDLVLDRWRRLSSAAREALARELGRELPAGFAFEELRSFGLGERTSEIALYRHRGARFALVPGGEVTLGFDAARWSPAAEELESWRETAAEYGLEMAIEEHIASVTGRQRTVGLPAILAETEAAEVGWREVATDDLRVRRAAQDLGDGSQAVQVYQGDSCLRVRRGEDGRLEAHEACRLTHADLTSELARTGLRLPTSDEWEHLCGGGAATLFRWGDHAPCDRYPTDISPAEAAWREAWVLSGGKLARPAAGFETDWDLHLRPSVCGVLIASNPYNCEVTSDPAVTRGGDGGCAICGGAGFFMGWLTLATSYFDPQTCRRDPSEPLLSGYTVRRRVLPLT